MLSSDRFIPNIYAKAYYEGFVLTLILIWLPFKFLAYLVPFIAMGWFIVRANSGKTFFRLIFFLLLVIVIIGSYYFYYLFTNIDFILQNAFLAFLTYGSFFFFAVLSFRMDLYNVHYRKYLEVIKIAILVEASLGIFQAVAYISINGGNFDSATGDVVQGTLDPLSFLNPVGNFNNQIYTTNLFILLLFYTPYVVRYRKGIFICLIGFFAIVLASVWHLFLAFLFALGLITVYFNDFFKRIKLTGSRLLLVIFLILIVIGALATQPKNFSLVAHYYEEIISKGESPKTIVAVNSVTKLPNKFPWVYAIGLGPGQYSSRAGLIGTGQYFGDFNNPTKIPLLSPQFSPAFDEFVFPYWEEVATNPAKYGNSTMSRPFSSIQSILIEAGFVAFTLITLAVIGFINRLKRVYSSGVTHGNWFKSSYAYSCAVLVLFFVAFSFFENYMEVTQAIFPGLLIMKYFYSCTKEGEF